jgi:hypothetical protein
MFARDNNSRPSQAAANTKNNQPTPATTTPATTTPATTTRVALQPAHATPESAKAWLPLRIGFLLIALVLLGLVACDSPIISSGEPSLGIDNPGKLRDNTPVVLQSEQPGDQYLKTDLATLDYSKTSLGYICAETLAEGKFVVRITAPDGMEYVYPITVPYSFNNIPLSCGDGMYHVEFLQNISGVRYAFLFEVSFEVALEDPMLPFLYPNRIVGFAVNDTAVMLSQEVTEGATSDIEAIDAIYLWCVMNLSYDYDKAKTVQPGYVPNNADTLMTYDGICYDYAVLCASMMRAQRIPARLEVGYIGDQYHAWLSIYSIEHGTIRRVIIIDPKTWKLLDPTIDSSQKTVFGLGPYVTNEPDYEPLLFY